MDAVSAYPWLARLHGYAAVLALALLLHPVISLPANRRRTRWTAALAAALLAAPAVLGWAIYPTYRVLRKPGLGGWAPVFEIKEHLASYAVALALGGACAAFGGGPARIIARDLLAAAWLCGVVAAVLSVAVAGFP